MFAGVYAIRAGKKRLSRDYTPIFSEPRYLKATIKGKLKILTEAGIFDTHRCGSRHPLPLVLSDTPLASQIHCI
ncbi:hypothetical protein KIPB_009037 [Kipferlia bialata]|uniref:Uncharacterized protein n=1 Tax=Kipferlia bialata TaxID=797122 RepID=A0A9K3D3R7_9EUKA|nr:hypothetical protein KIPB_009037 [Kipferlia bialata]|eukprot:g9037.t1